MADNLLVGVITRERCGVCVAQVPSVCKIADGAAGEGLRGMIGILLRGWEHLSLRCYMRLATCRERLRGISRCGRSVHRLASTVGRVRMYRAGGKMRR